MARLPGAGSPTEPNRASEVIKDESPAHRLGQFASSRKIRLTDEQIRLPKPFSPDTCAGKTDGWK